MPVPTADFGSLPDSRPPRHWRNSKFVLVVIAVSVGASLVWWSFDESPTSTNRQMCRAHLKQIARALHSYHDRYDSLPPAYVLGPSGEKLHSWRVLLLPYLGEQKLYDEYRLDEPWNGPHNHTLITKMPAVFACPSVRKAPPGITKFLAPVGRKTAWPEQYCAQLGDFADGTSNTVQVIEVPDSDVLWLEPRDLTYTESLARVSQSNGIESSMPHDKSEGFHTAFADGSVRFITPQLSVATWRSLLSINGGRALAGVDWPIEELPEPRELPPARPAGEFRFTDVFPIPASPISPGRNYVYCATFELAWDDARRVLGGMPIVLDKNPRLAIGLNGRSFDRKNLSPKSYLARGAPGTREFIAELRDEMSAKFPGKKSTLLDRLDSEQALLIYAYLQKTLRFETAFDALPDAISFHTANGDVPVRSFGIVRLDDSGARGEKLQSQVGILDYRSDNDFIVRLAAVDTQDEIVLAKMVPNASLGETIAAVRRRIQSPDPDHVEHRIVNDELLAIPRLVVSIERRYHELVGCKVVGTPLHVEEAAQVIQFGLDETGALLESEAAVIGENGHDDLRRSPVGRRRFIFDRPFLIYLIERSAEEPYFAAWIETAEVMEPVR